METPKGCEEHQSKYKPRAWEMYTIQELGSWVHLFMKRAEHRTDETKKEKDLTDAQNYLNMIQEQLNKLKKLEVESFLEQLCDRISYELKTEAGLDWDYTDEPQVPWTGGIGGVQVKFKVAEGELLKSRGFFYREYIEPCAISLGEGLIKSGVKKIHRIDKTGAIEAHHYGVSVSLEQDEDRYTVTIAFETDRSTLVKMRDALRHRGPDGVGQTQ